MATILDPGFTSTADVAGLQWDTGTYAGTLTSTRELGPNQKVAYFGATTIINGIYTLYQDPVNTNPTFLVTAGFDPAVVAALQVVLKSTGQIWPVGYS